MAYTNDTHEPRDPSLSCPKCHNGERASGGVCRHEGKPPCKRETLSVTTDGICVDCDMPADQHKGPDADPVQARAIAEAWVVSFGINATDEGRVTGLNIGTTGSENGARKILDLEFHGNVSRGALEKMALDLENLAVNLRALAQRNHK